MKKWWKGPAILSVVWFAVLLVLSILGIWYISTDNNPAATLTESQRAESLGKAFVGLLAIGLFAIWGLAFERHRRRQRQLDNSE